MRNTFIITALLAGTLATPGFAAAESASREEKVGVGAGAAIGAIAGGPVGLIIGAAIGAKIGDEFNQRNGEVDALGTSLNASETRAADLRGDVETLNRDVEQLTSDLHRMQQVARPELLSLLQAGIEMDLLFRTDEDVLTSETGGRIQQLAASLAGMQDVRIQLDGFADERGDESYNQELSARRVQNVRQMLVASGIKPSRINISAHGESPVDDKSLDSFALQRKVSLTLYLGDEQSFAANP